MSNEVRMRVVEDAPVRMTYVEAKLKPEQSKTVTPTNEGFTVLPDEGSVLSSVVVNPIPEATEDITITANGDHDVRKKRTAHVDVPIPPGYIIPSGTKEIAENGTGIDVREFASVNVNVPGPSGIILGDFNENKLATSATVVGVSELGNRAMISFGSNAATTPISLQSIDKIYLSEGLTSVGDGCFQYCQKITSLVFPTTCYSFGDQLCRNSTLLEYVEYLGDIDNLKWGCYLNTALKRIVFRGNVNTIGLNASLQIFEAGTMELFDFSNATKVPELLGASLITNAASQTGCVIKIPQALLTEWQAADNWRDVTGVSWQGV